MGTNEYPMLNHDPNARFHRNAHGEWRLSGPLLLASPKLTGWSLIGVRAFSEVFHFGDRSERFD
jgi:hypothetical protein